jgi:P27 family predicted phage terminase small subunit
MGKRGPRKEPTKLKILKGITTGLNNREPDPPAGNCQKDPWWKKTFNSPDSKIILSEAARFFDMMRPRLESLGTLTESDEMTFVDMCWHFGIWKNALEKLLNEGFMDISVNKKGAEYNQVSPYVGIADKAYKYMIQLSDRFGLSPSARSSLVGKKSEADSTFADLINRGKSLRGIK